MKELYVKVCTEKDLLEERMKEEGETAVSKKLQEVSNTPTPHTHTHLGKCLEGETAVSKKLLEVSNHTNTHTDPPPPHKHTSG